MMVRVTPRYHTLTLESEYGTSKVHDRRPIDDLLSFGSDEGRDIGVYMDYRQPFALDEDVPPYGAAGRLAALFAGARSFLDRDDLKAHRANLFMAAAHGAGGYLLPSMGEWLEDVRFLPNGVVEVPTIEALAAWSLLRAVEGGGYEFRKCDLCGDPFLSSGKSNYCRRYALDSSVSAERPEKPHQTCLEVGKVRDYRARKKEKRDA